ncbi:lysin B [Mycobacterium phage Baee]|uniref:Lysin B n=1 Tax=Mycobacterium phage Baee TaxID=1647306 RepID=A0A0F6SJQ3_9CAUD|nr:lysin B [Mycobacterium phage Baee]AKF14617.1 lysin B [Mycobacterium phage Baee]
MMPELKLGYQGPLYAPWFDWFTRKYSQTAPLLGKRDGYFGSDEKRAVEALQRNLGIVIDGVFGDRTASAAGYTWPGADAPPVIAPRRPIWFYSCPGSGADWWLGPSYDVGQMIAGTGWNEPGRRSLNINHQPVGFPKGGYLGLMGGDPTFSYIEVITAQKIEFARLLRENPDVKVAMEARRRDRSARVDVELWPSGYSQSADGMCDAVAELFGDGGEFELIRDRINGLILFGNPATPVTGIARKTYPAWLNALMRNINMSDDFYAVAKDRIRPAFYAEIIKAEMELPFFVHVLRIAVPIVLSWASTLLPFLAPLLGGLGPGVQLGLGMISGLQGLGSNPALTQLLGMANGSADLQTTERVEDILSPTGILSNIPDLIGLLGALPGLQSHGLYHATAPARPEFGNRVGTQFAYDIIAGFRR